MSEVVGGGAKKVLYTLDTVRRIGLRNSAKALKAKNTCKACGLGMGGQLGGMTNEKGEFPSVCNKSIQAQSTDIQQPIPKEVFEHTLADLRELSPRELEHIGRLDTPLFKAEDADRFETITWEQAYSLAAEKFGAKLPQRSFFYASGRSSNEAAFILQLFARLYGSNNINNCSYYCHQATGVGLHTTIGAGTSTVELDDLSQCDLLFLIGANPASNHPRLIHQLKEIRARGGDVIVINPAKEPGLVKFAVPKSPSSLLIGGHEIASYYLQPKIGSDVWLLKGIAKAVMHLGAANTDFIGRFTDGFEDYREEIERTSWDEITHATGLMQQEIETVSKVYADSAKSIFAWGMGITHHLNGSENVEYIANLALLRGMVGQHGAGLLPLRGHSNIQGVGTIGVKPVLEEAVFSALETELDIKLSRDQGLDTLACLEAAEQGEIDTLLAMGGNLYSATPDSAWAGQALDSIPFKLYLTTTLNQGHLYGHDNSAALILPVAARDEETQATTQESMFNFVRMSDGGIKRLDNVKPETEVLVELANRVVDTEDFDFSVFKQHRSIRATIAACIPGMEDLKDIDVAKKEFHIRRRLIHHPEFNTPSGKAHFVSRDPHVSTGTHVSTAPHVNRDANAEPSSSEFPFTLATVRSEGQFNSIIYEEADSYRSTEHRNVVLMNQDDLEQLGIKEGELVDVRSSNGEMLGLQACVFDLPRGNALTYYPEANALVSTARDPRSKTPAFKSVAVALSPASVAEGAASS